MTDYLMERIEANAFRWLNDLIAEGNGVVTFGISENEYVVLSWFDADGNEPHAKGESAIEALIAASQGDTYIPSEP